jgi:glycine/D-amino acid oxidase-like deaminating enzyme
MSTKFNIQNQFNYAVIGGGCFGVSTALALQIEQPNAKIILFEGSETKTASKAFWKTIRIPYMDEEYVPLAEESEQKWQTEHPYRKFYRRTGWIQVVCGGSYKPFHSKERSIKAEDLSDMVRSRDPPQLDSGEELWLNEEIGVAHSALTVEAVAAEAAVQGVVRQQQDVSKLLIKDGVCYGVECVGGITITAETTIIAAGAWTPALLESSNIQLPQGDFFCVTAIGVATLPLDEDEYEKFKSMPILIAQPGTLKSFNLNFKFLT